MGKRECRHRRYETDDSGVYVCNKCGHHFDFCAKCGELVEKDVFESMGGYCNEECRDADNNEEEVEEEEVEEEEDQHDPIVFGSTVALPNPFENTIKFLIGELLRDSKKTAPVKRQREEFLPTQEEVEQEREKGSFKIRKILGETSGLFLVEWDDDHVTWEPLSAIRKSHVYKSWRV